MKDLERLQELIGREFDEVEIIENMTDEEEEVIVSETTVKCNFDGDGICTCWNVYYNTEESGIYDIWVSEDNIIVEVR